MPQPITQAWELTIRIPWWILDFYHIKRGLLITLEIMILVMSLLIRYSPMASYFQLPIIFLTLQIL